MNILDSLPDSELEILNNILPWASFVHDSKGRRFGKPYSATQRPDQQAIPDPRIVELNMRIPLHSKTVLEVGCFEGNHTCALAQMAKRVKAFDGRIEHIVKTITRCAMFGHRPEVFLLNLESETPEYIDLSCDVLHHIGVLYHLENPVQHLHEFSKYCTEAIMLDTHVASPRGTLQTLDFGGKTYKYTQVQDGGRAFPFAGMGTHAKWLTEDSLIQLLSYCGFDEVDVAQRRAERNGPRVLIYAKKTRKI